MSDSARSASRPTRWRRSSHEFISLLGSAVRMVWSVSRIRAVALIAVQATASLSLLLQVLLIDRVLNVVLDLGSSDRSMSDAVLPVVLLAGLTALSSVIFSVGQMQQRVLGELVSRAVLRRVLDVSQTVDLSAYDDPDFYDHTERVRDNAASQTQILVKALALLIGDGLGVIGGTVAVLTLAPALTPLLLLSGVPLLLTSRISGGLEFAFSVAHTPQEREREYLQSVLARREEAKEVRAFSLSPVLRERWERNYASFLTDLYRHTNKRLRLAVLGNLAAALFVGGALLAALAMVQAGALSLASAGACLIAVRLLGSRVGGVTLAVSTIFESTLFLRDLREFFAREPVDRVRGGSLRPAPPTFACLTVSDVTFTYPLSEAPTLCGVSLEIRRGEVVALVGENGSGKSTLAKLLAGLYEPDAGGICWDGADVRTFEAASVRSRIAVFFQDFVRYKLTAQDNIGLGHAELGTDERMVRNAAKQADADAFLAALPAGYRTVLSKEYADGTDLSLGQWQRVALARAFIRDAPFVILDEPSASLDARAEHDLFERIRTSFAGRTILLISHRFSTVRSADRIYVLSAGRVIEQGDHSSLMAQAGLYAELFQLQADAYVQGDVEPSTPGSTRVESA